MPEQRLARVIVAAVVALGLVSHAVAQSDTPGLDELKTAISSGQQVSFRFKFNSLGADSPGTSRLFACCGNPAVYMTDGTATLSTAGITFRFATAIPSFTVTPEKIIEFTSQPMQASRVHMQVLVPGKKGTDEAKHYYLYNPAATGAGDPAVGGPGASITCVGCDRSMETFASVVGWIRSPNRTAVPSSIPTDSSAAMTNNDVVKLVAAGLSEQVVAAAVRQARARSFDLSPQALVALKVAQVPDAVVVAMLDKPPSTSGAPAESRPAPRDRPILANPAPAGAPSAPPANACTGVEMMGLYKVDMRPAAPLIVYQAKVRNGTSLTRIVTVGWMDFYGQEKVVNGQVGPGAIGTFELGPQESGTRQPINLRVRACE